MYYFNYTKSSDADAACRQKFVILITDGADTYACSGNGQETQTDQYKRRRETVAQARALANAGYYVFVVGFGSNMPYYQQNTLNWAAYYGKTYNTDANPIDHHYVHDTVRPDLSIRYHTVPGLYISTLTTARRRTLLCQRPMIPESMEYPVMPLSPRTASQLNDAILNIRNFIITLLAQSTSYVAPVVPISQFQRQTPKIVCI